MDIDTIIKLKKNIKCIKLIIKESNNESNNESYKEWKNEDITSNFDIDKITHKYSNTKIPLYRFFYNKEIITRNNNYIVTYQCLHCDVIHTVALNNILRKINKNITKCRICKELDEEKRKKQSEYMLNNNPILKSKNNKNISLTANQDITHTIPSTSLPPSLIEKLVADKLAFENYDDEFKDNYFRRNMTYEEFEYIKKKIISIQNSKFNLTEDFIYYPCVSISNQTRFCPYLYSSSRNCIEKIHNITLKCDNCNNHFISKDLHSHKNKIKALCKECNLTNNIFKLRSYTNLSNEKIMYQSKFELKFIRFCNEKKIYITNGPKIEYYLNNKRCTYRVDFAIPKIEYLIEIKDNHIWHRDQVNSGKWQEKVDAANKYIENNEKYSKFIVIFPKNYMTEMTNIIEKYWNNF